MKTRYSLSFSQFELQYIQLRSHSVTIDQYVGLGGPRAFLCRSQRFYIFFITRGTFLAQLGRSCTHMGSDTSILCIPHFNQEVILQSKLFLASLMNTECKVYSSMIWDGSSTFYNKKKMYYSSVYFHFLFCFSSQMSLLLL